MTNNNPRTYTAPRR